MDKTSKFVERYEAPEIEVVQTVVEYGFDLSSSIDDAWEEDYGDF